MIPTDEITQKKNEIARIGGANTERILQLGNQIEQEARDDQKSWDRIHAEFDIGVAELQGKSKATKHMLDTLEMIMLGTTPTAIYFNLQAFLSIYTGFRNYLKED